MYGSEFRPSATMETQRMRMEILQKLRAFFTSLGFLEVETPILSADTVVDRNLDPMSLVLHEKRYFLQTSPEFAMKRLVAAWNVPIWQVCKVFRQDELGTLHNPEFTMLEYYRPGDDLQSGMDLLDQIQQLVLQRGRARRLTYTEAFQQVLGLDPLNVPFSELVDTAQKRHIVVPEGFPTDDFAGGRDEWLDLLLSETIQPTLGIESPVILYDYPVSQAALAVARGNVAERFELYVAGIELANGYHELCDAHELRQRNRTANALRRLDGKDVLPDKSRLLDAMDAGLPPCAGTAIGLDRLVMVALGKQSLDDVLLFPFGIA